MPTNYKSDSSAVAVNATSIDFQKVIEKYRAEAMALRETEVVVCRANTDLIKTNLAKACAAFSDLELQKQVLERIPSIDFERVLDVTVLGETVAYLARSATTTGESASDFRAIVSHGNAVRRIIFNQMLVLVDLGIIDRAAYAALRTGRGPLDLGNDLVDAAAMLTEKRAILEGKLAIEWSLIEEARQLGFQIRQSVTAPGGIKEPAASTKGPTADLRDRMWTLLVNRYDELRRLAKFIWLDEAEAHVPALLARKLGPRAAKGNGKSTEAGLIAQALPAAPSEKPVVQ